MSDAAWLAAWGSLTCLWVALAIQFGRAWGRGEAAERAYRDGHAAGRTWGFREGLATGRRIEREARELDAVTIDVWRRDAAARRN